MNKDDFLKQIARASGNSAHSLKNLPPTPPVQVTAPISDVLQAFIAENTRVSGEVRVLHSLAELHDVLRDYLGQDTVCWNEGLASLALPLDAVTASTENATWGVSMAQFAVAAIGSVAYGSGSRLKTLLPPCHIGLLWAKDIVPDLIAAYDCIAAGSLPSAWGFHTGPSRSADIEQTMVLGVHGPGRQVTLILDFAE